MMNSNNTDAPPLSSAETASLKAISDMLTLLASPAVTQDKIKLLLDASAELQTQLDAVRVESAALDTKRSAQLAAMTDERAAFDTKLKQDRAAFDDECAARASALSTAEAKAKQAAIDAEAERVRALTLSNDLESRLSMIQGAATAPLPAQRN